MTLLIDLATWVGLFVWECGSQYVDELFFPRLIRCILESLLSNLYMRRVIHYVTRPYSLPSLLRHPLLVSISRSATKRLIDKISSQDTRFWWKCSERYERVKQRN